MGNCKNEIIKLGNKVRVSDPCYGTNVWCSGELDNVKAGDYYVMADVKKTDWGIRVCSLAVFNVDSMGAKDLTDFNEQVSFEVGVDSGQAGIYDVEYYNKYHTTDEADDIWYDEICNLTLSKKLYGTTENCAVSRSGYGDGGYDCFVCRNKEGQIVGIRIVFIEYEDNTEVGEEVQDTDPEMLQYYIDSYGIEE